MAIPTAPHELTGRAAPMTLGHEILGTVVEVGDPAHAGLLHARVVVNPTISCGDCTDCTAGRLQRCASYAAVGVMADGGLATWVVVPPAAVHVVPDSVPDDRAVLAEPVAIAIHVLGAIDPGTRTVAIVGGGAVGLLLAAVARRAGIVPVVVEPSPARRGIALRMGAAAAVEPTAVGSLPSDLPAGSFDVAVDCSGSPDALGSAVALTRPGGRTVVLSLPRSAPALDVRQLVFGERTIVGSLAYGATDWPRAIDALVDLSIDDEYVLAVDGLEAAAEQGFHARRADGHPKVIARPDGPMKADRAPQPGTESSSSLV